MHDFLCRQPNISRKNLKRLRLLATSKHPRIAELATVVLAVALVTPGKRNRIGRLLHNHPDLFEKLEALDLLPPGFQSLECVEDYPYELEFPVESCEEVPLPYTDSTRVAGLEEEIPF